MLRKTAARAFGGGERTNVAVPRPRHHTDADAAADRLFLELQTCLNDEIAHLEAGPRRPQVASSRSLARGIEFVLKGPQRRCRFLNDLTGVIVVTTLASPERGDGNILPAAETVLHEDALLVQSDGGTYRPAIKPLATDRTSFTFCTAAELARHYVQVVSRL